MGDFKSSEFENNHNHKSGPALKQAIWGTLLLWPGSIALALQIKTLLNEPAGVDPSFDLSLAAFFLFLSLLGAVLDWRFFMSRAGKMTAALSRIGNTATVSLIVILVVNLGTLILLFSANSAFFRGYHPLVLDEPSPDYSLPVFPTPVNPLPTPTFDPGVIYISGNIISSLDGFRIGEITLNMSPSYDVVNSIQLHIFRIPCTVQQNGQNSTYAVDASKPFLDGPFQVQNQNFYVNQSIAVIHGVVDSPEDIHGTIYLHYTDPSNNQSCDIGNATWDASTTQ